MGGPSLPLPGNRRGRRDLQLEEFVRCVQLMAGQVDASDLSQLREQCREIAQAIPVMNSPARSAIGCAILVDVIARLAGSKDLASTVSLVLSAARLCGKLDLSGMVAILAAYTDDTTTRICATSKPCDSRVRRALTLIEASYGDPSLTLGTVAADVHLSPWHLARLFVEHTGISFKTHLTEIRLRHATRLLEQTFLSIKEISYSCGYGQLETFERAFKKCFGLPPTVWRAQRLSSPQQETSNNSKN